MNPVTIDRQLRSVAPALTTAWLGLFFHDLWEFGRPAIENSVAMGVIAVLLFTLWRRLEEHRRAIAILMLVYATISLIGALTSVLPLELWPFEPEQSLKHYVSHVIWALAGLPLIWDMITFLRKDHPQE
jgi:hypothetical protein